MTPSAHRLGPRSRRTTARTGRRMPASRRAVMSQITVSTPKATIQYAPDHLTAVVRPSSTPAPNRHHRAPSAMPAQLVGDRSVADRGRQPGPHLVPVGDHAGEGAEHEHRLEDVQQGGPGLDVADAVADQQHAGDAAEQGGPGHPADHPDDQQDADDAGHRGRQPPAGRGVAEQPLADGDQLLAERRVHDDAEALVVLDAAVAQDLLRPGSRSTSRRTAACRRPCCCPGRPIGRPRRSR